MKTQLNPRSAVNALSKTQIDAAENIRRMMSELEISMHEVRSYYRLHAPPPKQARRVLTIAQRVALNQIKSLVRRHSVTDEELKAIYKQFDDSADKIVQPLDQHEEAQRENGGVDERVADAAMHTENDSGKEDQGNTESARVSVALALAQASAPESRAESMTAETKVVQEGSDRATDAADTTEGSRKNLGEPGYVKYRHPATDESWDGVGQKPGWLIKALLIDGMLLRDLLPIENFPLKEETAGLPAGVPFEELAERFNLRQAAKGSVLAEVGQH